MRSLLYADWCSIRSVLVRYVGICLLVAVPVGTMANEDGSTAPGVFVSTMLTAMLVFYIMLALFSADEHGDWEQMRMTLPITPRVVVQERYAFIALSALGVALSGGVLGMLVNTVLAGLGMLTVPRGILEVFGGALGATVCALAYLALVMPYVFKVGMSKARITFSLPFVACMLLNVPAVRDVLVGVLDALERATGALGSPAPLFAAGAVVAAALYVCSMLVAQRLYAARDF